MPDFKDAIAQIQKLHPSAAVFARAHQLIASKKAEMEELANIIKLDTALTAEIIRLSNSGALGGPSATGSLQNAMGRVGLAEVDRFLGLSLSKSVLNRDLECYGISAYSYWSFSVSTAIVMELLAKKIHEDKGEAYTIGILHAVGRLVINQVLNDLRMTIYWDGKTPIEQWEMESVGFNYATAGALLLEGWGFPAATCSVIEHQLAPGKIDRPSRMLKMLNFSLNLLLCTGGTFNNRLFTLPDSNSFLKEHDITLDQIKEIITTAKQKHCEAVVSLGISQ